jgi:hypothetical protein
MPKALGQAGDLLSWALGWLWWSFRVALGWLWWSLGVALVEPWGGFKVALGSQWGAYRLAINTLWGGFVVALMWLFVILRSSFFAPVWLWTALPHWMLDVRCWMLGVLHKHRRPRPSERSGWANPPPSPHHPLTIASPEPRRSTSVPWTEVLRRGSGEAPARFPGRSGPGLGK